MHVFIATKEACELQLVLHADETAGTIRETSSKVATVALGAHLHVAVVTLSLPASRALKPGVLHAYDVRFLRDGEQHGLRDSVVVPTHVALGYGQKLPTVALPPGDIGELHTAHGSCRKPHGGGQDMLAELDTQVAASPKDFSVRPHLLLMTGDQIYADDVALPMLRTVHDIGQGLLGWREGYGLADPDLDDLEARARTAAEQAGQARDLFSAPASSSVPASLPGDKRPGLHQKLAEVRQALTSVFERLPGPMPDRLSEVSRIAMLFTTGNQLSTLSADVDAKAALVGTSGSIDAAAANDLWLLLGALRARLQNLANAVGDLVSDGTWGELDLDHEAPDAGTVLAGGWGYTMSRIAPPQRASELQQHAQLSSGAMAGHLMFLGEWYAMYLLVWSDTLWQLDGGVPQSLATAKEAVPNYGVLGETSLAHLDEQRQSIQEFAAGTPRVRRLLANVPSLMIFDDHEVTDDWNLNLDWVKLVNQSAAGPQLLQNALVAYAVFQDWGNQPADYEKATQAGRRILAAVTAEPGKTPPLFDAQTCVATDALHKTLGIGADAGMQAGPTSVSDQQKRWDYVYQPSADSLVQVVMLDTRTRRQFPSAGWLASLFSWLKTTLVDVSDPNPQIGEIAPAMLLSTAAMAQQLHDRVANGPLGDGGVHLVVSPAPVFGLPLLEDAVQKVMAEVQDPEEYDLEAWAFAGSSFERLMDELRGHDVVLLSGDVHYSFSNVIHFGSAAQVAGGGREDRVIQLCSSSLKNETPMTRNLGALGFGTTPHDLMVSVVDDDSRRELLHTLRGRAEGVVESMQEYGAVGEGAVHWLCDTSPPSGENEFQSWWDETGSMFDPIRLYNTHKVVNLFTMPRVVPLGLVSMGYGVRPFWEMSLVHAQDGGTSIKEEFTTHFLSDPRRSDENRVDQREVVGSNNYGTIRLERSADGRLGAAAHTLWWQDSRDAALTMRTTEHRALWRADHLIDAVARVALGELRTFWRRGGETIRWLRADRMPDARARSRIKLYAEALQLLDQMVLDGQPQPDWNALFVSYCVAQAGARGCFEPTLDGGQIVRSAKQARVEDRVDRLYRLFAQDQQPLQRGDVICSRTEQDAVAASLSYDRVDSADPATCPAASVRLAVVVHVDAAANQVIVLEAGRDATLALRTRAVDGEQHAADDDVFAVLAANRS